MRPVKSMTTSRLGGGALDHLEAGALLAQDLDGLVDLGVAHVQHRALDLRPANIARDHIRIDLEHGGESSVPSAAPSFGSMLG